MILADKIVLLRKHNNWSQEEFAMLMEVSRQAVSKWELAQSVPELDKILLMANLFGVSTDYLLKDELELEEHIKSEFDYKLKRVTLKEAQSFLKLKEKTSYFLAIGIALCIISPTILIGLNGLAEVNSQLDPKFASSLGMIFLILFVAAGITLFLIHNYQLSDYKYLNDEIFEVEYGVTNLVKQKQTNYRKTSQIMTIIGILLIILSVLSIFVTDLLDLELMNNIAATFLLILVASGVFLLVLASSRNNSYLILLQEGEYSQHKKRQNSLKGAIAAIYWLAVTAYYLFESFTKMNWTKSWVIWPVMGVVFAVIMILVEVYYDYKNKA